jgi:hypothetical protein
MTVTTCAPTVEVDVADIHVTYREVELPSACPRCDADLRGTEGNAGLAVVEHHFRLVPRLGHLAPGRGFVPEGRDEPEAGGEISGRDYGCGTCGEVLARGIFEEHRTGELDLCKQLEVINLGEVGVTLGDLLDHAIGGVEGLQPTVDEGSGLTQFKTTDGRWWCVLYEVRLRELARPTCDGCDAEVNPAEVGQEGPERVLCRRCSATST